MNAFIRENTCHKNKKKYLIWVHLSVPFLFKTLKQKTGAAGEKKPTTPVTLNIKRIILQHLKPYHNPVPEQFPVPAHYKQPYPVHQQPQ